MNTAEKLDLYKKHKAEYVTPKSPVLLDIKPASYLASAAISSSHKARQFPLQDMLLWIVATALVLALVRLLRPTELSFGLYLFIFVTGVSISVVAVLAVWAGLGVASLPLRLAVLLLAAAAAGSIHPFLFRSLPLLAPRWHIALPAMVAGVVLFPLLIFRHHGYRWQLPPANPPTDSGG